MPSIHPQIVNKEGRRKGWPLEKMAGVAADPTMTQCPGRTGQRTASYLNSTAADTKLLGSIWTFITVCWFCFAFCPWCPTSESASRCVQKCVYACIHACASFNVLILVTVSVSTSCCHKKALCSQLKSSTSGQINYQVICHYLLSTSQKRSQGTGHIFVSACLIWSGDSDIPGVSSSDTNWPLWWWI